MNKTFRVGNLVIMQKATHYFEYDDLPAVIVKPLATRWCLDLNTMQRVRDGVYGVRILVPDGLEVSARPWQLKRLVSGNKKNWRTKKTINKLKHKDLETD